MEAHVDYSYYDSLLPDDVYHRTYQLIHDAAGKYSIGDNTKTVIENILSILEDCVFLNMGRVLLPNHNNSHLRIRYAHGLATEKRFVSYSIEEGVTGYVYRVGNALYLDDLESNGLYMGKLIKPIDLPYSKPAFSGVPLKGDQDEIIGVLCVNHGYRNAQEISTTLALLEQTARVIGDILQNPLQTRRCLSH